MADSTSNKVLRFLISRDILKGKSREELLAKLDGAGFSGAHAELFIAQAERKVRARNRRCALVSAALTVLLLARLLWGDSAANNDDVRILLAVMAAVFMASGFYFWFVARWQAAPPKPSTPAAQP